MVRLRWRYNDLSEYVEILDGVEELRSKAVCMRHSVTAAAHSKIATTAPSDEPEYLFERPDSFVLDAAGL